MMTLRRPKSIVRDFMKTCIKKFSSEFNVSIEVARILLETYMTDVIQAAEKDLIKERDRSKR